MKTKDEKTTAKGGKALKEAELALVASAKKS